MKRLYEELTEVLAHGIYGITTMLKHDPTKTYVPPTREEIITAYRNQAIFHAQVKIMVANIINVIEKDHHLTRHSSGQADRYCPVHKRHKRVYKRG